MLILLLSALFGCAQNLNRSSVSKGQDCLSPQKTNAAGYKAASKENDNAKHTKFDYSTPEAFKENKIESPTTKSTTTGAAKKAGTDLGENSTAVNKVQTVLDESLGFCQASQYLWQKGELENAFDALDQAYSLILNVDTYDIPKLIQQKDDLRFMISKRILEIYASRNIVVNGDHNAIPLVINKHIQKEIDRFTVGGEKKFFIASYKRSGMYRRYIVERLKKAGLPEELSWLPLIESGFKTKALSKARALGLWQFIPSTGYKFGLNRDTYIDERLDPFKATNAAIAYMKELHQIFGDWTTVLAAYNCGEGRVLRIIRTQNVNYLDNFWDLYERLPLETSRYVPRFLATLHILSDLKKYGLDSIQTDPPLEYETVTVSRHVHLKDIGKNIGAPEKKLVKLNPELRYKILPDYSYLLRIPLEKSKILLSKLDKIPLSYPPRRSFVYHKVKRGESLSVIAKRYRTSIKRIALANNINKRNCIVAGKILKIPRRGTVVYGSRSKGYKKTGRALPSMHAVKKGDSLWIIARRYGTTTKKLQKLNKLSKTNLHIGQVLKIPGYKNNRYKNKKPGSNGLMTYQVKSGDSPFTIAKQYNMALDSFLRKNCLTPRSTIYPGQKLYVE